MSKTYTGIVCYVDESIAVIKLNETSDTYVEIEAYSLECGDEISGVPNEITETITLTNLSAGCTFKARVTDPDISARVFRSYYKTAR